MKSYKIKNENLRKLIILCTYNLKGITPKEKIEQYLPIQENDLSIYVQDNKIVFERKGKEIGEVWIEANTYSNLEILKLITWEYGIKYKNHNILELIKYRSNIVATLL